jgi:hypothetical protein
MRRSLLVAASGLMVFVVAMAALYVFGVSGGLGGNPVAGQENYTCSDPAVPQLSFFDPNKDDILTVEELQAIVEAFPDNTSLIDLITQFEETGADGIQYQNCTAPGASPVAASPTAATPAAGTLTNSDQG